MYENMRHGEVDMKNCIILKNLSYLKIIRTGFEDVSVKILDLGRINYNSKLTNNLPYKILLRDAKFINFWISCNINFRNRFAIMS